MTALGEGGFVGEDQWFNESIPATTLAVAGVRDRFELWLTSRTLDAEIAEDLTVVLSELCANAVAAGASGHARIPVRAWMEGAVIVLEVENPRASSAGGVVFRNDSDPLRGYGQGLMIVTAYTDSIEVIPPRETAGLVVRCRKELVARGAR